MGNILNIFLWWIIQVKPGAPAVPLKAMMVFLIHLYVDFYGFTYFIKFRLGKKLEKQTKNNSNGILAILFFIREFLIKILIVLNIFIRKRGLGPPPKLAATDLNRQL